MPYTGYQDDGNNTVIRVYAASPAEHAGLKAGDYIRSIGGISVEDTSARAHRERAKIGETRTFVVERRDQAGEAPLTKSIDVTYASLPDRDVALNYAAVLIGFCFLGCGLIACLKVPAKSAALLALVGICFCSAFANGPYMSSFFVRTLVGSIQTLGALLGFAFLLHYMLETPAPKQFLQRKHALKILYAPAVVVILLVLFLVVVQPRSTSGVNQLYNILLGLFVVAYFGWALAVMIRTYAKATRQERTAYGLTIALAGSLIGLLPVIVAAMIGVVAPKLVLPGGDFYFLTLILIPISLTMAMMRQSACSSQAAGAA
jgi:membrane-associated protease RseP (regulator of RpoE activity)